MFLAQQPPVGLLIYEISRSHTTTHHSRKDSSELVISLSQRPLPDNTQHSLQTDVHASGGIRTHAVSKRAAANLRLRRLGHWDRDNIGVLDCKNLESVTEWRTAIGILSYTVTASLKTCQSVGTEAIDLSQLYTNEGLRLLRLDISLGKSQ